LTTVVRSTLHEGDLWEAVDSLIDRAPSIDDLREHRLQLLGERRWTETGRSVPIPLTAEKARAVALFLPVQSLLSRIAATWEHPMIILKGPELAARYPDAALRTAGDIDLLVADAEGAHAALRAAGFSVTGDPGHYVGMHHLQPLIWNHLPVAIELHHAPNWLEGLKPPSTVELFRLAVPATVSPEYLTLAPAAHAVILAVHAWSNGPLHSLRDLIDIAVVTAEADIDVIEALARRWGVYEVWRTTYAAVEALFASRRRPLSLRLWARHLEDARGRTVVESHLERWLSPLWALPPRTALWHTALRLADDLRPVPGELWRTKILRARLAVLNARRRRTSHQRLLEETRLATPPQLFLERVERRRGRKPASDQKFDGAEEEAR
jgi:hypothetical protein